MQENMITEEKWIDVKGYDGIYRISNKGKVKSIDRVDRGNHFVKGRVLKEVCEGEKKFDEKTMDIWYSFNELNGHKKMKNKELGQKYGMIPSRVTYYLYIVNSYILKNAKLRDLFMDLRELVAESRDIKDRHRHVLNA